MTEVVFTAEPARLLIAAVAGIALLLLLIIRFKFHPVLSLLISALIIGLGAGMPVPTLVNTVEKGAGDTLQGIVLLIGLGSLFGGILEVSGGAQCVAQTLVSRFGEKKAGLAFGITGLVVGTTVFFEAGVVILIPLAFGLAKKTKKSALYYVIPLLAGLASGFAFIPPSAGSVLVANMLGVDLGIMIAVGVPTGILSLIFAGILWSMFIGNIIHTGLPSTVSEVREEEEANLPKFSTVAASNRSDPSGDYRRRYYPLGSSGLRNGRYHWTGTGKKWIAADFSRISDCGTGKSFGRCSSGCNDDGCRNHGIHAGSGRSAAALSGSDGMCNHWRSNSIQPCE